MDEDQVNVDVPSNKTEVGLADRLIVGGGVVGVVGPLSPPLPPPPPPPPPQETMNKTLNVMGSNFLINLFSLVYFSLCSKLTRIAMNVNMKHPF